VQDATMQGSFPFYKGTNTLQAIPNDPIYEKCLTQLRLSPFLLRLHGVSQVIPITKRFDSAFSTRRSHCTQVANIAYRIAKKLGLNADFCQLTGLAHDIGHPPLGHNGERALRKLCRGDFYHRKFGAWIASNLLEINLPKNVIKAIYHHSGEITNSRAISNGLEPEILVLRIADDLAWFLQDPHEFFFKTQFLNKDDYCQFLAGFKKLGKSHTTRVTHCIDAVCRESLKAGQVQFISSLTARRVINLQKTMTKKFYFQIDQKFSHRQQAKEIIETTFAGLAKLRLGRKIHPATLIGLLTDQQVIDLAEICQKRDLTETDLETTFLGQIMSRLWQLKSSYPYSP